MLEKFQATLPYLPSMWVAPKINFFHNNTIFAPVNFLLNTPSQFIFANNIARIEGLLEKFHITFPYLRPPWVAPKIDFFTISPSFTPANLLHNTPSQFIFANNIARIQVGLKNFTQPSHTSPSPQNDFFTITQLFTFANVSHNIPSQFIFPNNKATVEVRLEKFHTTLPYLPSMWVAPKIIFFPQ